MARQSFANMRDISCEFPSYTLDWSSMWNFLIIL